MEVNHFAIVVKLFVFIVLDMQYHLFPCTIDLSLHKAVGYCNSK